MTDNCGIWGPLFCDVAFSLLEVERAVEELGCAAASAVDVASSEILAAPDEASARGRAELAAGYRTILESTAEARLELQNFRNSELYALFNLIASLHGVRALSGGRPGDPPP